MLKGVAVIAAFALAVFVGGRGAGLFDSAATSARPAPPQPVADAEDARLADRGRWVREVTPICRRADDWFDRQPNPQTVRGFDRYLAKIEARNRSVNAQILALRPPRGARGNVRALGSLFKTDERLLSELLAATRRRDWKSYSGIAAKFERIAQQENRLFRRLGATACTLGSRISR
jgi:hypothetical protein